MKKGFRLPLTVFLLSLLVFACAPGLKAQLEYADFLLDKGNFSDAITLLDTLDTQYPDNIDVKRRLASAHLAHAVLKDGNTYLSLVADFFEEPAAGQTDFQNFASKSPELTDDDIAELGLAKRILNVDIADIDKENRDWLQLGFARLLEINVVGVIKTGALSPDDLNNITDLPPADGIPDDFDPTALSPDDETQFNDNLDNVEGDFTNAGLDPDLSIIQTLTRIRDDVAAAASLADYLNCQFGVVPCP